MVDIIETLKTHAGYLHRQVSASDALALKRMNKLAEFKNFNASELQNHVKRRHCLALIAQDLGFNGWSHITHVLVQDTVNDFGTLLYPRGCGGHTNIWCSSYEEAKKIQIETGGYLLAYRNQFLVVESAYIQTMGLDPDDSDWDLIGRDWARPGDVEARSRLYGRLIALILKN